MTTLQQMADGQVSPEVVFNEVGETLSCVGIFGKKHTTTSGLTWGYYGGYYSSTSIADGTVSLTNTTTNYVVVARATGVVSTSTATTNWDDTTNYGRLYKLTTAGGVVTATEDHRFGANGIVGSSGSSSSASISPSFNFKIDTGSTADSDPGAGLIKYNNATQASATQLYIDDVTDDTATDLSTYFGSLGSSGFIHLIQSDDASKWQAWKWTATPTDGTGYWKFTVTFQAGNSSFADDADVQVLFVGAGGGGGSTQGKHAIYVAAGSMRPSVTGGCAPLAAIASASNQPDIITLDFDTTTEEYAQFSVAMPKSWDEGTVTFKAYWSHASTTTNFGVAWKLQGVAVSDDDAIAVAYGTAVAVTDTGGTTNDLYATAESSAITIAGTPAAEDMVFFRVFREPSNGSDTMAIDARLHGITLFITTSADTDA